MRRTRALPWLALASATALHAASARPIGTKVGEQEARRLAAEAIGPSKFPFDLDFGAKMSGRSFFVYDGISAAPAAQGSFGFFAVNRWTGDVWSLWGCHKLSTPTLRKSQAVIKRRFKKDEMHQYFRLSQLKPECVYGG
jgi:hypothetical protein